LAVSADDIKGAKLIEALNVHHGAINGLKYGTQGANTLDRVLILGDHIEGKDNTGGIAIEITAATVGAITRVRITNAIIKSFSRGMELTGVYGAVITAPSFSDLATPTRPYFLTSCKNIRGRDAFNATLVTTDATATLVFDMGDLADGNLLKVTMHALAAKSDMSAVGSLRRDFTFKRNGATTSLVASGTLVNDGGSGLPADALSAAVSAHRAQFNVKGIAAETWNWTVNFDFELQ